MTGAKQREAKGSMTRHRLLLRMVLTQPGLRFLVGLVALIAARAGLTILFPVTWQRHCSATTLSGEI